MFYIVPRDDPKQALRIKRFFMAFATYIVWMLIALYCYYNGLFARMLGPIYLILTLIVTTNLILFLIFRTGVNRLFKDPSLTMTQMVLATIWTMAIAYGLDEGRGIMLMLYMVVFIFGTFRLNIRQFSVLSAIALIGYISVIILLFINYPDRVNLKVELLYLGTLFTVLVWFSFVGSYINDLRKRLSWTNKELNDANALTKQSEERFRDLAELLPETVFEADTTGRITFVNRSAYDRFGYLPDDIGEGLSVFDMLDPEDHDTMRRNIQNILSGEKVGLTEFTARRKDGTPFPAMAHITSIVRDGNAIGQRGFLIDVTDKKNLEEQLMRSQKMEAIGTMAGGIAHDFNNLLMGILGNVSLVLMKTDEGDSSHVKLKNVEEYVKRASDLTKQLLGFARGGKYEVKLTDLGKFIRQSSEMFGRTRKEIRIHCRNQKGLWNVEVDHSQMEQVFLNLFVNAWQAMPDGGELFLSAENVDLNEIDVRPHEIEPGRYVKVTVADTGLGMDEATKARIFEPFFTTKELGHGTGLGLASVYGIAKHHGGFVHVESEPGAGSAFMVYLPASDKTLVEEEKGATAEEELRKGRELILLIDDEEMILDVGSQMLSKLGYTVLTAQGGRAGIEVYRQNMEKIDLVILDFIMPDIGGKETFEQLRKMNSSVNLLLSSGYSLDDHTKEILEKGGRGFIQKPFSMRELSARISEILDLPQAV
ncbi:MAG: PAS domain S-box protein [Desulfomonilia bacterium]|jgi:PAS domain S-box-containing protein